LEDPLGLKTNAEDDVETMSPDAETNTSMLRPLLDKFRQMDRRMDAGIESDNLVALRASRSVKDLRDRGVTAEVLLREAPEGGALIRALLQGRYHPKQLRIINFTLGQLVSAGLTAETWAEARSAGQLLVPDMIQAFGLTAEAILMHLCAGVTNDLSRLVLTAEEWRMVCACPAKFFADAGVSATTILDFGYSMKEWSEVMGLNKTLWPRFKFEEHHVHTLIRSGSSVDDQEAAYAEFKHLFKLNPPSLEVYEHAEGSVVRGADERGRGGRGRYRRTIVRSAPRGRLGRRPSQPDVDRRPSHLGRGSRRLPHPSRMPQTNASEGSVKYKFVD